MSQPPVAEAQDQAPVAAERTPGVARHAAARSRGRPKKQTTPAKRAVPKSYARIGHRRRANFLRPILRRLNIGFKNLGQSPSPPQPGPESALARSVRVNNGSEAARPVPSNTLPRQEVPLVPLWARWGRNTGPPQINHGQVDHASLAEPQPQLHSRYRQASYAEQDSLNISSENHIHDDLSVPPARPPNSIFGNGSRADPRYPRTPSPRPTRALQLPLLRPPAPVPNPAHVTSYFSLIHDYHHAHVESNPSDPAPNNPAPPLAGTPNNTPTSAMTGVHNATIGLAFATGTLQYTPGGGNLMVTTGQQALPRRAGSLV